MKIKGELLKKYRQNKGYSLRELASKSGISLSTLNKWETSNSSNPLPSKLSKLANSLDITIDDLLFIEENEEVEEIELVQNECSNYVLNSPRKFLYNLRKELNNTRGKNIVGLDGLLSFLNENSSLNDEDVIVKYIKEIYRCEENEVGIIFDAISFLKVFADAKVNYGNITFDKSGSNIFEFNTIEELFMGHEDILELLNEIADLQYSLANIMPLPNGNEDQKGYVSLNQETPDLFYNRIKKDNIELCEWINKNKERYALDFFTKYKSPYVMVNGEPKLVLDLNDQESIIRYKESLIECIASIYKRATQLCMLKDRHKYTFIKKISTRYLYIDNHHQAPVVADMVARDYKSVLQLLRFFQFEVLDLDCDFTDDNGNALDVLKFMVDKNISVNEIKIHSDYIINKPEIIQYIKEHKDELIKN